jgi:hypothetical protein
MSFTSETDFPRLTIEFLKVADLSVKLPECLFFKHLNSSNLEIKIWSLADLTSFVPSYVVFKICHASRVDSQF